MTNRIRFNIPKFFKFFDLPVFWWLNCSAVDELLLVNSNFHWRSTTLFRIICLYRTIESFWQIKWLILVYTIPLDETDRYLILRRVFLKVFLRSLHIETHILLLFLTFNSFSINNIINNYYLLSVREACPQSDSAVQLYEV